jgi:transposase
VAEAGVAITDLELRMTIKTLAVKGQAARAIARQLRLCEGTVRYHLRRMSEGATDGRSHQVRRAEPYRETIDHWIAQHGQLSNLAALHEWLVAEHDYSGSLRSVQRFVRDAYPPTPRRSPTRATTRARYSTTSGTETSSTLCGTPSWCRPGFGTSGRTEGGR